MAEIKKLAFRKGFVRELIALRLWSSLTQKEFADVLKISSRTLSDLEMGKIGLNEEVLVGLFNRCHYYVIYMLAMAAYPELVRGLIDNYQNVPVVKELVKKALDALRKYGPTGEERYYYSDKMRVTKRMKKLAKEKQEQNKDQHLSKK